LRGVDVNPEGERRLATNSTTEGQESGRAPPPQKAPPWTAGDWLSLFEKLIPFADRYLKLKEGELQHERELESVQARSAWRVLAILMAFLGAVIALMSWLTFSGKVSGDALLFLVGTAAGYILALVQRQLFPEVIDVSSND
jgi:hypothetical protein